MFIEEEGLKGSAWGIAKLLARAKATGSIKESSFVFDLGKLFSISLSISLDSRYPYDLSMSWGSKIEQHKHHAESFIF